MDYKKLTLPQANLNQEGLDLYKELRQEGFSEKLIKTLNLEKEHEVYRAQIKNVSTDVLLEKVSQFDYLIWTILVQRYGNPEKK